MGKFYDVKCTHCGYTFRAKYGGGRANDDSLALKRKFEEGKAEKGLQGIYDSLRKTVTEREDRHNREFVTQDKNQTDEELQEALLMFKAPWVSDPWYVYECAECKKFLLRKRIKLICDKGTFEEQYVKCPECRNPDAAPVDEEDFRPRKLENTDGSMCDAQCPKCNETLAVLTWGFWD